MADDRVIEWIERKYTDLVSELDERGRRRWAAVEARSLGHGGITAVAKATGLSDRTIRTGIQELESGCELNDGQQRKRGGGRKKLTSTQPELVGALDKLVSPVTRGDPTSALRWTCKSTRRLERELKSQGFKVSASSVGTLLKDLGFSLQSNRKTREGTQHPDRDAQFEFINKRTLARKRRGEAALSVDTKKKEILGNKSNSGRTYEPKGQPRKTDTHDFPDKKKGKVAPYGVYDIHCNEAWVSVGISSDTAQFAVATIRMWWKQLGRKKYKNKKRLLVTADSGGSNSSRSRLWKVELQKLANELGMIIEVCHYPPGTSKWNKIEHRVFCHITKNWQGVPLETTDIVVNCIGSTATTTGLEVHAWLDEKTYQKGIKVSDELMQSCVIKKNDFHGEWNYEFIPQKSTRKR